ncbi:DUF4011 domain-containing protein [TM7 phylum sp. oral taxon 353]|nr:DUF4011 domain-containing protein [TM7 phylum sp. oral taxon 353]
MSNVDVSKNIEKRINDWKKSLLDMTKRNRLLWYKPYKTGSLKLEKDIFDSEVKDILDELNKLAFGGHTIEFSTEIEIANEQELPLLEYDEKKKKDRNEIVKNRTKTLYAINKRIKLENEEKGLNIGYIAVGFLEWYESDDANSKVKSPLVLIPIKTEQDGRRDPLRISLNTNEEITFNPVIKKKLESDFNLIFDIDPQNYETPSIQKILEQIKKITKNQLNWRVLNEAVIDTFNFQNLAIWHDLDKNAKLVIDNSFSRVLAGSELGDEGFVFEKEPDLDKTKARNNINIFEVDSSQQTAITDFMTEEDSLRDELRKELRAYAVGYYVEDCLSNSYNIGRRTTPVSHKVERIRREVNGTVDSEDAFTVHDDLMHRIGQAGLDYIYKEVV